MRHPGGPWKLTLSDCPARTCAPRIGFMRPRQREPLCSPHRHQSGQGPKPISDSTRLIRLQGFPFSSGCGLYKISSGDIPNSKPGSLSCSHHPAALAEPGGTLVEPWWNPGGTLVEPSWNLSGLRAQSFQLLGKKKCSGPFVEFGGGKIRHALRALRRPWRRQRETKTTTANLFIIFLEARSNAQDTPMSILSISLTMPCRKAALFLLISGLPFPGSLKPRRETLRFGSFLGAINKWTPDFSWLPVK